jgi:hypothetical protein
MKAERPFNILRDIFKRNNKEARELTKYIFEKSDSISLWIIGLSIGGVSLFANNIADIQSTISHCYLKAIIFLLAISVITGLIYRSLFLYFFVLLDGNHRGIDIAFSRIPTMDDESFLNGDETFQELISAVKDNLGDLSTLLIEYEQKNETEKFKLYSSVVDSYKLSVEFAKKDLEMALDFVAETYANFTGTTKEKFRKQMEGNTSGLSYKWTIRLTSFFYLIYLLSFISALLLFAIST